MFFKRTPEPKWTENPACARDFGPGLKTAADEATLRHHGRLDAETNIVLLERPGVREGFNFYALAEAIDDQRALGTLPRGVAVAEDGATIDLRQMKKIASNLHGDVQDAAGRCVRDLELAADMGMRDGGVYLYTRPGFSDAHTDYTQQTFYCDYSGTQMVMLSGDADPAAPFGMTPPGLMDIIVAGLVMTRNGPALVVSGFGDELSRMSALEDRSFATLPGDLVLFAGDKHKTAKPAEHQLQLIMAPSLQMQAVLR